MSTDGMGNVQEETFIAALSWNYAQFDNLGYSFMVIFKCLTQDGWVDTMYSIRDARDNGSTSLYFLFMNIGGAFGLMLLVLAVLQVELCYICAVQAQY